MPRLRPPHTSFKSGRATYRFYLGDCLELLDRLPPGSIDAIVTSPPYNLGIEYRTYDDTIPREELAFHFTPEGNAPVDRLAIGVRYQDPSNVGRWRTGASGVRCRGNTWFIPYETIQNREKERPHPATFPPRLPEMCLRLHGLDRIRTVADPFLGLGSTAVACAQLGVTFVGIEMDARYLKEAVARTRAALGDASSPGLKARPGLLSEKQDPVYF